MAILGDMLYYGVIALATLGLSTLNWNPSLPVGVIFLLMLLVPTLLRPGPSHACLMLFPEFCP